MRFFAFPGMAVLLLACGGGGGGPADVAMDDGGFEEPDAGAAVDAEIADVDAGSAITFAAVATDVLGPRCGRCHSGAALTPDPVLVGDGTYERIVGAPSEQAPAMSLVAPGAPEDSYLFRKIEGTHGSVCTSQGIAESECGERMPRRAPALSPEEIALVRDWIAAGAPR